jgi:antitoxin component YwqK of YwqJK toxin-antitoxin module
MLLLYMHRDIIHYILNLYLDYENIVPILEHLIPNFKFDITPHKTEEKENYITKKWIIEDGKMIETDEVVRTGSIHFKKTYIDDIIVKLETFSEHGLTDCIGMRSSIQNYKNGLLDGRSIKWGNKGTLASITEYKKGKEDGMFIEFNNKGFIESLILYKDGVTNKSNSFCFEFEYSRDVYYAEGFRHTVYDDDNLVDDNIED